MLGATRHAAALTLLVTETSRAEHATYVGDIMGGIAPNQTLDPENGIIMVLHGQAAVMAQSCFVVPTYLVLPRILRSAVLRHQGRSSKKRLPLQLGSKETIRWYSAPRMGFKRMQEDFICDHCAQAVRGNGYTNHCPKCLWSKHVDLTPGDRASTCLGLMRPLRIEGGTDDYRIIHKCEECGYEKRNETAADDDPGALIALAARTAAQ